MTSQSNYILVIPLDFETVLKKLKKKKPVIFKMLEKQIEKVLKDPSVGKPLRNVLRNYRRIHIDSFVLIYEISLFEVRLLDFDHHDKIYKKYK